MKVVSLGKPAHFFIPATKWDNLEYQFRQKPVKTLVHEFLIANYNGYTVKGPFPGLWRPSKKSDTVGEQVIEVQASFLGKERIPKLQKFLAGMCSLMKEECMYLETGEDSFLVYP